MTEDPKALVMATALNLASCQASTVRGDEEDEMRLINSQVGFDFALDHYFATRIQSEFREFNSREGF